MCQTRRMCGRFTQRPTSEMAAIFGAEDRLDDEGAQYNVALTQRIAVVVERRDNSRAVVGYRWGLVPSWTIHRLHGRPLALAGLWAAWHDPESPRGADPLRSATILTTVPNAFLCQVHVRMPVVLSELHWDNWLDPNLTDPTSLLPLLRPAPEDLLEAIPVGPLVNSARNQGRELVQAVGPALVV
jgi:putative SOS response-associated peptidase YedK